MPRYIDADILIDLATHEGAYGYVDVHDILNIPTADVAEVVRCKDCEYGVDYYHDGECYCSKPCQALEWFGGSWDFYCADGKRKENTNATIH